MAVQFAFSKIVTDGLALAVEAADPISYPGSGNTWRDLITGTVTGSLVSCSFSSDFKGGIVFNNPTSSVQFPGSIANYGTSSFTAEMAFRPTQIQGIHYLVSKNSGSFPNWGVYLSGSGGSGKLWAEYRISSAISCSVSSSTTFVTGSTYFIDAVFAPEERRIYINNEGSYDAISIISNGTGSLTSTGSLFVGNLAFSSSQAYSGSIFTVKAYSRFSSGITNYRALAQRLQKTPPPRVTNALALVVAGGGGGGYSMAGGGGAGGLVFTTISLTPGSKTVSVGAGGAGSATFGVGSNGLNSFIDSLIAIGGGGGAGDGDRTGRSGGSGGGASREGAPGTGSVGQGNFAGSGSFNNINGFSGGGGGGAGSPGNTVNSLTAGIGGTGLALAITSVTTYYAGGGGGGILGGTNVGGVGGIGGGGAGAAQNVSGSSGSANTGGGGGGGGSGAPGGNGGSGIVVIRYPGPQIATGGTVTTFQGDVIHTFTATGSHTFTVF
jgi:hypothetical protein